MTRQEENKEVVRRYVTAFNRGDLDALRAIFAPEAMIHGAAGRGRLEEILPVWRELTMSLGTHLTIEEMIAEEDAVAVRFTERGTFKGPCFGQTPTGKSYEVVAMEWFVVREGRISERWGVRDHASRARQTGMVLE
jgi:steroid delta-isomerase-like uncharacterized protein